MSTGDGVLILREAALVRRPWKNGGGTTAEIAVHPPGAGFDDFEWRLSMADVASDGPFSPFPGIDRTLLLLAGNGITLRVDDVDHALDRPGALLGFSGDATTVGHLHHGPIRDFNVMTRRGRAFHALGRATGTTAMVAPTLLLADRGPVAVRIAGMDCMLGRHDAILVQASCDAAIRGDALLVALHPA